MANGSHALISNTTGGQNTATGAFALENNATGSFNTANRSFGLAEKTTATPLRKRLRRIRKLRCVISGACAKYRGTIATRSRERTPLQHQLIDVVV